MMVRALHGLADCFLLLCTISFPLDCAPATSRSLIANQYVRVSKVELPSHDSLSLRANGHLHVLIAEQPEAVSVMQSDSKQAVTPSENLWTLDGIQSYQIFNRDESQVSVLLLEITPSPGRVVCSGGNACPWSIRDVDPWPVFLSEFDDFQNSASLDTRGGQRDRTNRRRGCEQRTSRCVGRSLDGNRGRSKAAAPARATAVP